MRFEDYETIEHEGGDHLLRHREGGWYTVVRIADGQVYEVTRQGAMADRYARASSDGVTAVGPRLDEREAWGRYYLATRQWGIYVPPPAALVAWREREGLSQARAAAIAGVLLRSWQRWESDERDVPQWLADVLRQRWGSAP